MLSYKTSIRVRYADTDKMEFVYNGKYLEYFEVGRTELLRSTGVSYKDIEDNGYRLPLIEAGIKYKKPARYDDLLEIEAIVSELYTAKVHIDYIIRKEETNEIVVEGFTDHIFLSSNSGKPIKPPKIYVVALAKYFPGENK